MSQSSDKWLRQPTYPVRPNFNHFLARGLLHFTSFFGGALIDWTPVGPVTNWTVAGNPIPNPVRSSPGIGNCAIGQVGDGSRIYYHSIDAAEISAITMSLCVLCSLNSAAESPVGGWGENNASFGGMSYIGLSASSVTAFCRSKSGFNGVSRTFNTSGLNNNTPRVLSCNVTSATNIDAFNNGKPDNGTLANSTGTAPNYNFWTFGGLQRSSSSPAAAGCVSVAVAGWNRVRDAMEHLLFADNPWQIFNRYSNPVYFI